MTKPKRVLIVEDSLDFSILLKRLLEREGYQVERASNGREALDLMAGSDTLPHLILLDLMMPVMDGIEFRKHQELDARFAEVPVVVMTAHRDAQEMKIQIGARDFIRKPPDMDLILEVVKRSCL